MKISRVFTTEHDLELKVSSRFLRRLRMLRARYLLRNKEVDMLKAACVAWAMFCTVESGQMAVAHNFNDMMHGECAEWMEMDGYALIFREDDACQETMVWDAFYLLLLEHPDKVEEFQYGYDMTEGHIVEAYKVENEDEDMADTGEVEDTVVEVADTVEEVEDTKEVAVVDEAPKAVVAEKASSVMMFSEKEIRDCAIRHPEYNLVIDAIINEMKVIRVETDEERMLREEYDGKLDEKLFPKTINVQGNVSLSSAGSISISKFIKNQGTINEQIEYC